ncbi:unnamed protein product [Lymnaea stagnalis]|uniref:Cadherin domain-containing protein n=1 Tax=Lymnaea stagnalis TaxID=6523 RepID=A0AAV2HBE0_LYMST
MGGMDQHCFNICICFAVSAFVFLVSGQVQNQPPTWDPTSYNRFFQGFSENTLVDTKLADLKCNDPDPGDLITYSLKSGKAVRVSSNGSVYLAVKLDFEAKDTLGYDLTIACVDISSTTGLPLHPEVETRLQISVDDANDNPPTFEVNNLDGYSFSIREDAPVGTTLAPPITIRDLDRTANARLDKLYLICNSNNPTEISSLTESSNATCRHFRLDYIQLSEGVYQANLSSTALLDYEDRPVFSSKIIAVDGPGVTPQFTTTVNVQINLIDAQDTNPIFINPGASTTVSEGAVIGTTVLNFAVSARDGDVGDKRPVALTLIGDLRNAFNLTTSKPSTVDGVYESQLIVKNQLDREAIAGAYTIVVKATELDKVTNNLTTATATATYTVFVSDINDNPPRFNSSQYVINVTEVETASMNQTIQISGLHITCSDLDEPINAHYRVVVVNQTFPAYSISPNVEFTGNASMFLKVDNPIYLDYDVPAYRQQTVVLVATEVGTRELFSGSTTIILNLLDINDNAPNFDHPSYTYNISESVSFFRFPAITATDKDSGRNGQIKYRLEGDTDGKFTINSDTGVLTLNGTLDYEVTPEYVFLVYGTDQAELPRSSQVQVIVNIQNYNDKGPVFQLPLYQSSVNESSLVFLTPVVIKAIDDDDPYPSNVTYRIASGQSPNNAFVLDPYTGNLTLRQFLNYDDTPRDASGNRTGVFVLTVEASDNGRPPQINTVQVRITVIDENNHSPVLNPTLYTKTISEIAPAGTTIAQILGTDLDSGDFGKITYRVGAGQSDNFFVNPDTGLVTVNANSSFDFNVRSFYTLIIYATDGGAPQMTATGTVQVTITDDNNKNPVFRDPIYSREVDEKTAVGTPVITVTATDTDSTSSLSYSITTSSIIAYDRNGNRLTSTFPYDYQNAFGVRDQGVIYVKQTLNKNLAQEIRFTLVARDVNTRSGTGLGDTQIALSITGQADTGITFDPINQVFMNEDALVNNNPITVTARDPNNVAVRNYTKISGSNNFRVDPVLGRVILSIPIDYENDPEIDHLHRVVIKAASNDGLSTATGTCTISIVDVNDNQPMFQTTTYTATVSESALFPTEVISIYATDADSKSYGPLEFSISAGLGSDDFEIFTEVVPTGSITSRRGHILVAKNRTLDFNRRGVYELTLRVGDNQNLMYSTARLYNTARLSITVIDENNNSPTFFETTRTLYVPETAEIGSSIVTVNAIDADRGRNGDVVYNLEASDNTITAGLQLFSIIPYIGTINVASSLIGLGGRKYSLLVRARDQGDIPNSGTMVVDIYVLSTENDDGNPKWISPSAGFTFTAPEETPNYPLKIGNNTRFFEVTPRRGMNITYELSPYGPYAKSFTINRLTGEITVVDSLDREVQETYNLLVYAIDTFNGTRYQTGRQFDVKLTDIDDNEVSFYNPKGYAACQKIDRPLVVYVQENIGANQTVFTLRACDPDGPGNNGIQYSLYNNNAYCAMQNNMSGLTVDVNGHLITKRIIDYEQDKEFKMCVVASTVSSVQIVGRRKRSFDTSQVNQTLTDVAYIDVIIVDQDDNGPKFPKTTNAGVVPTEPGTGPVLELDAVDPDGNGFNDIIYRIESSSFYPQDGSPPVPLIGAFTFRGEKRALYPALPSYVDYAGGHFVLTVTAIDKSNTSLSDSQTVKIYVYKKGQALKVILDLPPSQGFNVAGDLVSQLDKVSSDYFFTYLEASEHRNQDGEATQQTDVCFLAVNSKSENILNIRDIASLLDEVRYKDVWSKTQFKAVDRGQCYPSQSSEKNIKWRDLWWVLVALAIFLFVCCLILIVLTCILYDRYKRYETTQKSYMVPQ